MVAFVVSVKHHVRGEYGLDYEGERRRSWNELGDGRELATLL